ncbi:hypothetical protein SDC9_98745 [bioreactor metagenome]|uniref:Uncharacterized protein n=1 Tax=bioreactor metagenome TaxID=1076179 RepID=A0A645AFK7_9ZZZZ
MIREFHTLDIANIIAGAIQLAAGRPLWVQVAKGPGSGVAGIFKGLRSGTVKGLQHGKAHVAFALHLHLPLEGDRKGHRTDGFDLG